jgi:hypothetical protein
MSEESEKQRYFYQVDLELWSKKKERIFTFVNISHIPYIKLREIFENQITDENYLFDDVSGYRINRKLFKKHKKFLKENILCDFDFDLFEYWVSLSGDKIEKLKRTSYTSWPPEYEK